MEAKINFDAYFENALNLNEDELQIREATLPLLPDTIIDAHTHASHQRFIDEYDMPSHIKAHMMSTFPQVDIEQSQEIDRKLMPGKEIHKIRFAHVYPNLGQRAVTEYIKSENTEKDSVALFGLSNSPEEIDYTISELETGNYSALKMYYLNSIPPKETVYEYFPHQVLEVAQRQEVPIILHLPKSLYESSNEAIDVAEKYPDLKIILAHIGVANVPKPELGSTLESLSKHPNILVDTAMVDNATIVTEALEHLGAERILYGSDEPLNLMRIASFFNPDLQRDRVLTDYPYHWANQAEQKKWRHLITTPLVHSHWRQISAIIDSVRTLSHNTDEEDSSLESIFNTNAKNTFPNM
ncbi:amidohydrolase family protein [Candidatus Saccharibacteria bacterium TM7i]|nr:amidohydrolase family protein [Candidatus Saccharibacteria bacterium TM7i]